MREQQQTRRVGAAAFVRRGVAMAVVSLTLTTPGAVWAADGSSASASPARVVGKQKPAANRRHESRRARERQRLSRELRRSPRRTLRRSDFLRRAAIAGLRMPVTVRLRAPCQSDNNPDSAGVTPGQSLTPLGTDGGLNCASQGTALNERAGTTLGVSWLPTRFPLDGALFPPPAGEQALQLAGNFPMVIDFDAGAGYGGPGNIQARVIPGGNITSTGPLVVAELAGCAASPPPFVEAATGGGAPIAGSVLLPSWVDMNPFIGTSDGYLDLKLSVRSRVLGAGAACGTPGASADYDVPATANPADPWNSTVRIRWEGGFRIAPGITKDGAIRLGKITADGVTQRQSPTTGNIWGCAAETAITGAGLPTGTPCTSTSPLSEAVGPAPFPASLTVKSLSADVLLGDLN